MSFFDKTQEEEIRQTFRDQLYSKMEFVQESNPTEIFEEDLEYGKHILKAQDDFEELIREKIKATDPSLSHKEIEEIFDAENMIIFRPLLAEIDEWITKINVDYK